MKRQIKDPLGHRIKKQRNHCIACAIAAALLCLLCACGGQASLRQDANAPDRPGTEGENALSAETPGPAAASGSDLIPLSQETDKGRYTVGQTTDPESTNDLLCYIDYDLAQEIPLCAQPSCSHDSDACTAFVESGKKAMAPQTGDGGAIFFKMENEEIEEADGSLQEEIWAADADGSNRRLLVRSTTGSGGYSPVAEDDTFLYYFYGFTREGNGGTPERGQRLARVPLAGGESEDVFSWDDSGAGVGYEFWGVSGREVAVYRCDWGGSFGIDALLSEIDAAIDAQGEQRLPQMACHSVLLVHIDTGMQRELDAWDSAFGSAGRYCLWENGRLYWCADSVYGPIHWLDADGQSGELAALPEKSNDENAVYTLDRIVQGRLLVNIRSPETGSVSRCAIELSDESADEPADGGSAGSAIPLTLRYLQGTSEHPVPIEGQGETGILVMYEEGMEQSTGFHEDGTVKNGLSVTMRYGMISYEDFFASRPNYRPVEMTYGFMG